MFRVALGAGVALFTGLAVATSAMADDARTTRIEPRDFYGATVSIEAGVRVFRPLPRTTHVIVNPNGTPLSLSFKEARHTHEHHHKHSGGTGQAVPDRGYAAAGGFPVGAKRQARRHVGRGTARFPN